MLVAVAADVTDGGSMLFEDFVDVPGEHLTTLFSQRRNWNSNEAAIVGGVQSKIRCPDGLFNNTDQRNVVRLHRNQARLRSGELRHLTYGCRDTIVIDLDIVENRNGSPAGPDRSQFFADVINGLFHPLTDQRNF